MSNGYQKIIIQGNLGNDPDMRFFPDGTAVATLSVATSESWKDKSGASQERTQWHRCVVRGGLAEICQKYLGKGDPVLLDGKVNYRKFKDQNGQEKFITEVRVDQLRMLSGKGDKDGQKSNYQQAKGGQDGRWGKPQIQHQPAPDFEFDEDPPF